MGFLNFNPVNLKQSNLNKSLASYGNNINDNYNNSRKYVTPFLEKINLPFPGINFGYSVLNNYENIDTTFFSDSEFEQAKKILEECQVIVAIRPGFKPSSVSNWILSNIQFANIPRFELSATQIRRRWRENKKIR